MEIMLEKILLELTNGGIDVNEFVKWLSCLTEGDLFRALDYECSRTDFITFFLNFIHEDLTGCIGEISPQKPVCRYAEAKKDDIPFKSKSTLHDKDDRRESNSFHTDFPSSELNLDNSTQELSSSSAFKIDSDSNLNLTSSSLSPFHQRPCDFSTPNNIHVNSVKKSTEKISPLCLSDFLVNTPIMKKRNKKINSSNNSVRRITPTSITKEKVYDFTKSPNSYSDFNVQEIVDTDNENHSNLMERCGQLITHCSNENKVQFISRKLKFQSPKEHADVTVSSLSNGIALNKLLQIYIAIMNNYFVSNIISEIYFLVMLLTKKQSRSVENKNCSFVSLSTTSKSSEILIFFKTIPNVIYFVVKSLESQIDLLKNFDKSTLLLLSNNKQLRSVSKEFSEQLWKVSDKDNERLLELTDYLQHTNVYFNLDTDNRDNFPTNTSFHSFRKQRDLFYEIFGIWEINYLQPGWSFATSLGAKIKSLFSIVDDPMNFLHLCRLFKDQLLKACGKYHKDDDFSFLSSLPNVDVDKLNRLKNRLVTKESLNGLNAAPGFIGYEEFFKEFILTASNYSFNRHLCDIFISEIYERKDTKFSLNDYEDSEIDSTTKKTFVTCLKYLKVVAKFLGFLESLPYPSGLNNYSENLLLTQISVRKQINPSLDIKQIIIRSIEEGYIVLTIPWITEYLAMLDVITLRLPYYISVYKILFNLYRTYYQYEKYYFYNVSLVKFCLGWLFELPHFPDMEFFSYLNETESFRNNFESKERKNKALDDLHIVDQNILYTFCPYLEEIKKLLLTNAANSQATVKHITPVSAVQSDQEIAKKKIELELEEAFFHAQPASVRKTVEFVSERIASACVKHIYHDIVPQIKQKSCLELENSFKRLGERSHITKELQTQVPEISQLFLTKLREECSKATTAIMKEKVPTCVESLLAVDTLKQTKTTCVSITVKMCKDRVKKWMDSHINISIFTNDLNLELQKLRKDDCKKNIKTKPLFALPTLGNKLDHQDNCLSAAHVLKDLQCLSVELLEDTSSINEEMLLDLLNETYVSLTVRCDVNDSMNSSICITLADFSILLVVHRPDIAEKEIVFQHFVKIWNEFIGKREDLFKNILCCRNIMIISQSCNDKAAWMNMARFVALLIKADLISCDNFEFQCTAFYQKDWNEVVLQNMSIFLNTFLECYKKNNGSMDNFTYLLGFLSDFCLDL